MKTKKRPHMTFNTQEKLKAVLSIWTERRCATEVCREMQVSWTLVDRWQKQAMEGMVKALEPRVKEKQPALNDRLEKLLLENMSRRSRAVVKLEERLKNIQQQKTEKQAT